MGGLEQGLRGLGRECRAAGMRSAYCSGKLIRRDIFKQIAKRPGFQGVLDQAPLLETGQHRNILYFGDHSNQTF